MSFFHSLLSNRGQGYSDFSGFTFNESNPVILTGSDKNLRDQCVFEIDDDTWGMAYLVGDEGDTAGLRLGIKYATAPKSDPHNWTKVDTFLVETETDEWDTNIDGGDVRKEADGSWTLIYGDFSSGKVGVATRAAGTFGAFTKHASNPVIDNTGDDGAWNEYLRHPTWIKKGDTYHVFAEAREGANAGTGVIKRRIAKCTSTDLVNWTLHETPVFDSDNYPGTYLYYNDFWMPHVEKIGNYYFMVCFIRKTNDDFSDGGGFLLARSSDLETWTILNSERILVPYHGKSDEWDQRILEEPSLFYDGTDVHIYYNGRQGTGDFFEIGYVTLTPGAFNNSPAPLFQDDFADESINVAKWDTSPQGGITITEEDGKLKIEGDGETQSLVEVLSGLTSFPAVETIQWSFGFTYKRDTIDGGDCMIGISNADNSNRATISKGTDLNSLVLKVVIDDVETYSEEVHYSRGRIKILREGYNLTFWEGNGTHWQQLGDYTDVETWTDEAVFPKVLAANSTDAYSVELGDVIIYDHHYPQEEPYVLTAPLEDLALVKSRMTALTVQEETAISDFITACKAAGSGDNWDVWDEIWCFKLNADDAVVGFKMKVCEVDGASHGANGFTFDGTNDSIATHLHLINDAVKYAEDHDHSMTSFYLHTYGPSTDGNRVLLDGNKDNLNGSNRTLLFTNGTNIRYRTNTSNTTNRQVAGLLASDRVVAMVRDGSAADNEKLYLNGVLQSATLGGTSTGAPDAELEIGRNPIADTSFHNGIIGFLAVGKHTANFSQSDWNTDLRQLLTDLD